MTILGQDVEAIIQRVVALTKPERLFLFGSRITDRGDFKSDVDLLIVVPDPVGDRQQRQNELRRMLAGDRPLVDPWIMGRLEFEETRDVVGGLAYPATHEGLLVYERS